MQHLATFHRESSAETIAGRMEQQRIRTGLMGEHMASGDPVYSLFVSDRQAEEALRLLSTIISNENSDGDVLSCPSCGSKDVHPTENDDDTDAYFPLEPRFRLIQKSGDPIRLVCRNCDHNWS